MNHLNETYEEINRRNERQLKRLRQLGFKKVQVIWECEYLVMKNLNSSEEDFLKLHPNLQQLAREVNAFFKHHYKERPVERLIPRDSLRGGKESEK